MSESEAKQPPEGCKSMGMLEEQMQGYGLKTGSERTDTVEYKLFNKEEVLREVTSKGFYSAFHDFRDLISKYPDDDILVVADPEEVYGNNWVIYLNPDAKQRYFEERDLKLRERELRLMAAEDAASRQREEEEALANRVYEERPFVAQLYRSATADETSLEIEEDGVHSARPYLLRVSVTRRRDQFGKPATFSDREADHSGVVEFRQHKDPAFGELSRKVLDMGLQAAPGLSWGKADAQTQTLWHRRVNSSTQYAPRVAKEGEAVEAMRDPRMASFLKRARVLVEGALQQNEALDVLDDDLAGLGDDDVAFGDQADTRLKELRSFTDLVFSKGRRLNALDWHPTQRGVVAVACGENMSFERRVEVMGQATTSYLLVWIFTDLIHPQLVLES
eukprot:CAMPEP_0196771506 /NCGR_PEP_ID=MMETSP1104-20130614/1722_1 /TAXON_ID=33652 /ORGANISM="Cafeteria sp., Strain Caron Lab Isolate" /LENGTH=390 /DNA_ID=CAMNT_0042141627 /DNA_START=8 /DNA_END=1177 /DNA_ORIENTATION=+